MTEGLLRCGRRKRVLELRNVLAVMHRGYLISPSYGETLGLHPRLFYRVEVEQGTDKVLYSERLPFASSEDVDVGAVVPQGSLARMARTPQAALD